MLKLIEFLKSLPAPFSTVGAILESVSKLVPADRAPVLLAGVAVGVLGLAGTAYFGQLPMDKLGYVTKDDLDKAVASEHSSQEKAKSELRQDLQKQTQSVLDVVLPTEPNDQVVIAPTGDLRFEWTGPAEVDDYTLTLLALDATKLATFYTRDMQIIGKKGGSDPSGGEPRPARALKSDILNIRQLGLPFGEYVWTIKVLNSKRIGAYYRRFSVYPSTVYKIMQSNVLNAGTSWIPDGIFLKRDDSSKGIFYGFEADLVARVADSLGHNVEKPSAVIRHIEWDDLLTQLAENRIDLVISSMTKTRAREQQFNVSFSDGYFTTHQRFVVKEGKTGCLKDMTVGVVGGNPPTTNQRAAQLLSDKFGFGSHIAMAQNATELLNQIQRGDIDAGLVDDVSVKRTVIDGQDLTGLEFLGDTLDPILGEKGFYGPNAIGYPAEEFAIAVPRRELELLHKINEVLAALKKDGTLPQMQEQVRKGLVTKVAKQPLC